MPRNRVENSRPKRKKDWVMNPFREAKRPGVEKTKVRRRVLGGNCAEKTSPGATIRLLGKYIALKGKGKGRTPGATAPNTTTTDTCRAPTTPIFDQKGGITIRGKVA